MSDGWDFFPCQMGDNRAFIFFNEDISERVDSLPAEHVVKVRVTLKSPDPRGLPMGDEFEALSSLEDRLTSFFEAQAGCYVGRISVAGFRHFYYYVDGEEAELGAFLQRLTASTGYELKYIREPDRERTSYWQDLFPTADDRQLMQDMRVLEHLQKEGDSLDQEREIDHWAYFPEAEQRDAFVAWALGEGYTLEGKPDQDQNYGALLRHIAAPELATITQHTIKLNRKASELGGDYDGWETSVEAPGEE